VSTPQDIVHSPFLKLNDASSARSDGALRLVSGLRRVPVAEVDAHSPAVAAPTDPTAQRLAFLAAASEALASSLDVTSTLQEVARLAVPLLGDLCIVDVLEGGQLREVATAHVVPERAALVRQLREHYPPGPGSPSPAARVMASGEVQWMARVTAADVAAHTTDAAHSALIEAIGIRSHLAVPLVARGQTVGAISLGITESDRIYGPHDVALARDLARLAAVAIDNATLYDTAQRELRERRRAEDALRVSEERFRAMFEQSPLSTQILAADGSTIRVNRAWERLWGFTLEQLGGYNMLADPQLEATGIAPLLRRAFAGEATSLPAIRYDPNQTIPEGSQNSDPVRWVSAFAYPVKDSSGTVREVVLVHQDVTELRQREDQLRASEERLRLALAASRMNVWDWDLGTGMVTCSENAREFWGIDIGHAADFVAVIHPDDVAGVDEAARLALESADPYMSEYRLGSPGQPIRWVQSRGRVTRDADGRPTHIVGVTLDITDIKDAEERTRLLADAGAALGSSLDYHATLRQLSRLLVPRLADWCAIDLLTEAGALERVAVYHPDPAQVARGEELFARYPPHPDEAHGAWHVIRTGQPEWLAEIADEMLAASISDPDHLALLRALRLRSYVSVPLLARQATIGVLTLVYAESGRRYRESDLALITDLAGRAAAAVDNARLYERLLSEDRRRNEFLATLAHELRNPLAPIRTGLAVLRATADPQVGERTREMMERQLSHMVTLIDELLDLSRVTRGQIQLETVRADLLSILGIAMETSRPLLDAAGVQLVVGVPEEPVVLDADRTRLSQVVSNLLNNAAKFTPRGGRVELRVTGFGSEVQIDVSDTGIGIPAESLSQIFDMFVQLRDSRVSTQGLGIGLTLVRRIVELHGGRVWAHSDGPGRGSTFSVRLPVATGHRQERVPMPVGTPATGRTRRVLVVDDNLDAAEMLGALLRHAGHEVRVAGDGPAALDVAAEFRPDVALLDIGLPGMDGYELARALRLDPALPAIVLIALTGWGQEEDKKRARDAGFDGHLTKPADPEQVMRLVAAR
jgi:PAS domain S-box-containing protein